MDAAQALICKTLEIQVPPKWNSPCRGEGAYPLRRFTQVGQREELDRPSQLQPSSQKIFSTIMSGHD